MTRTISRRINKIFRAPTEGALGGAALYRFLCESQRIVQFLDRKRGEGGGPRHQGYDENEDWDD